MDNHVGANPSKIQDAIAEAARELLDIEKRLELLRKLQERAVQLENFIALGKGLLGGEEQETITNSPTIQLNERPRAAGSHSDVGKPTVVELARALFEEVGRPMRATEVGRILQQRGLIQGRWATEVVRAAMARNDDFERIAVGVYALKKWPTALKQWEEEAPSKRYSQRRVRRSRHRPSRQYSLTNAILELLEKAPDDMTTAEIERDIEQTGEPQHVNSVSGTLSRLVHEGRIKRTGTGRYARMATEERTPDISSQQTWSDSSDLELSAQAL